MHRPLAKISVRYLLLTLAACMAAQAGGAQEWHRSHASDSPLLLASSPSTQVGKSSGVTDTEVAIGSCCSLTGKLAERGKQLGLGAGCYLDLINDQGGVNGRKIKLVTCDDKYDPEAAIVCFNNCLKDKVFAGAFFVGSAPAAKYVRMGELNELPLLGFCTGSSAVYENLPLQFVLRRSYTDEVAKEVNHLWESGVQKIAVAYQNDAFGASVREAALKALKKLNAVPTVEASYSRASQDTEDAYQHIRAAHPEALIIGGNSDGFKAFVRHKDQDKWSVIFCGVSVNDDYVQELGPAADGVILSQVVPSYEDASLPAVKQYDKLRAKYAHGAAATATSFEAYLNAIVLAEGLKRTGRDLGRDAFVRALESMHGYDIGAGPKFKVTFGPGSHIGWSADSVYLTIVKNGKPEPLTDVQWRAAVKNAKSGSVGILSV